MALVRRFDRADSSLLDSLLADYAATVTCRIGSSLGLTSLDNATVDLCARVCFLLLVCAGLQTPGQRVIGLRFSADTRRRIIYAGVELLSALVLSTRARLYAAGPSSMAAKVALALDALRALSACALLVRGNVATVGEFVVGLQTVRVEGTVPPLRHASLSSVNTSLAFRAVSESAGFIRGFADWGALLRTAAATSADAAASILYPMRPQEPQSRSALEPPEIAVDFPAAPSTSCAYCGLTPACMPQQASCGHAFCYVCVTGHVAASATAKCFRCAQVIAAFRPLY